MLGQRPNDGPLIGRVVGLVQRQGQTSVVGPENHAVATVRGPQSVLFLCPRALDSPRCGVRDAHCVTVLPEAGPQHHQVPVVQAEK